jgi:hypothetical protein
MRQRIGTARSIRTMRARPNTVRLGGLTVMRFWSDLAIGSVGLDRSRRAAGAMAILRDAAVAACAAVPRLAAASITTARIVVVRRCFINAGTCDQPSVARA